MHDIHQIQLDPIIERALEEDWGYGDWTTDLCVDAQQYAEAQIIAKQELVLAGRAVAAQVFKKVDPDLQINGTKDDGNWCSNRDVVMSVSGSARSILRAERVALNFLGRMCGIATLTRKFVQELEGTSVQLLDTRKTTPGLRLLEKTATVIGGARNHRFGLCDGVIVKENHIRAAGSISKALEKLHESLAPTLKIEVEVNTMDQVKEALDAGADLIMLDNMPPAIMKEAVTLIAGRALIEASGNVTLENIKEIAATGVHFISTGSIIHSATWADLSLLFKQ